MKSLFCALTGALGLCFAASGLSAAAPPASAVYVTTFVEVLPGAAEQAVGFLREYRVASRREPGLLEGDGKSMRHVKLRPGKEVDVAALQALIDAAHADIKARLVQELAIEPDG